MTRVLFICQGKTCRSPIAEAVAARVFGPNHFVASAGIETAEGSPAARHTITVASEMGLDLSSHRTQSIDSFELPNYDILVPMDYHVASALQVPPGVRIEKFEIEDPYGKPIDVYRTTWHVVQRNVRRLYATDTFTD